LGYFEYGFAFYDADLFTICDQDNAEDTFQLYDPVYLEILDLSQQIWDMALFAGLECSDAFVGRFVCYFEDAVLVEEGYGIGGEEAPIGLNL
jgi:hypothetical protein